MTVEYARRGLIGALTPQANTTVEPEFHYLWPPGYAMINARMMSPKKTIEERLVDYWGNVENELRQFANAPVQAIAFGCTGTSYLVGKHTEDEVVDRIRQNHGLPFVTSAVAVTDALNALGASRIGIVSPYPTSLTEKSVVYWQSRGFDVVEVSGAFNDDSQFHPIYSLSASSADQALQLQRDKRLDAIVMLGTGMPTLAPIASAAGWDGPPVMSCMLCLAWRTVQAVDGIAPNAKTVMHWVNGAHWSQRLLADMQELAEK
jgi:maleate isomerase